MTELDIYKLVFGELDEVEWSGVTTGPGTSMGAYDGDEVACCPICGGLKQLHGGFIKSAVGHQEGCELHAALSSVRR